MTARSRVTSRRISGIGSCCASLQCHGQQVRYAEATPVQRWDVVVVGVGAVGSAALRAASEAGARTLGLELHSPAHAGGSTHGRSRIFRHAYFEHPDYVPLLRHSTARFQALERESGDSLLHRCGMLAMGDPGSSVVHGTLESARRWELQAEALDAAAMRRRFPWFELPTDAIGAFEADAGVVRPEAAVRASVRAAERRGAELRTSVRVHGIVEDGSGVALRTSGGDVRAGAVVVAAGAWAAKLLPELAPWLRVTRQVQAWIAPRPATDLAGFPCWLLDRGPHERPLYGLAPHPDASADDEPGDGRHPKVGIHGSDLVVDPDVGAQPVDDDDVKRILSACRRLAPTLADRCVAAATCLYTMSPDSQFLVGTREGSRRVHFAAGLSGHGFKLSPALGDALVDLALEGRTGLPIGFLAPNRLKIGPSPQPR
ncbi:MAG: N-methyl-L-tryptophan oxidase [Lysobacterales bacterium]|nr:MAG: N-methyl-L-tryptophan oxidase [Xanthomonadales bacterium]